MHRAPEFRLTCATTALVARASDDVGPPDRPMIARRPSDDPPHRRRLPCAVMPSPHHGPTGAALVHDFFVGDGGAEACAVEFANLLPDAPIYTSFFHSGRFKGRVDPARVRPWPFQRIFGPRIDSAPSCPSTRSGSWGWISGATTSSSAARSRFRTPSEHVPARAHISYVYTPLRYAWDLDAYLDKSSWSLASRLAARTVRPVLQRWDRRDGQAAGRRGRDLVGGS